MPADSMQANMAATPNKVGLQKFTFWVNLAGLTNAAVLTAFKPGFKFSLDKVEFSVQKAVTTAAKAATITPTISGEAIRGGVLSLTSANCTPKGTIVAASAITDIPIRTSPDTSAQVDNDTNHGDANDTITLTASSVTAFVEGDGELILSIHNEEVGIP